MNALDSCIPIYIGNRPEFELLWDMFIHQNHRIEPLATTLDNCNQILLHQNPSVDVFFVSGRITVLLRFTDLPRFIELIRPGSSKLKS